MKVPKIFVPEKDLDRKLKDLIRDEKSCKDRRVYSIGSLACIPKDIDDYCLRTSFEMIDKEPYSWHFGNHIPKYLTQAGKMIYLKVLSNIFTVIYILEFKSDTDLNEMSKKISLEEEISQTTTCLTKCLKKDNYLVAINASKFDKDALDVFGDWYMNNFGLEEL